MSDVFFVKGDVIHIRRYKDLRCMYDFSDTQLHIIEPFLGKSATISRVVVKRIFDDLATAYRKNESEFDTIAYNINLVNGILFFPEDIDMAR